METQWRHPFELLKHHRFISKLEPTQIKLVAIKYSPVTFAFSSNSLLSSERIKYSHNVNVNDNDNEEPSMLDAHLPLYHAARNFLLDMEKIPFRAKSLNSLNGSRSNVVNDDDDDVEWNSNKLLATSCVLFGAFSMMADARCGEF